MTKKYAEYLASPEWSYIRNIVLKRDGGKCTKCDSSKKLRVHHTTYAHIFHEINYLIDLITLCDDCHNGVHNVAPKAKKAKSPRSERKIIRRVVVLREGHGWALLKFCCNNMKREFVNSEYEIVKKTTGKNAKSDGSIIFSSLIWKGVMRKYRTECNLLKERSGC